MCRLRHDQHPARIDLARPGEDPSVRLVAADVGPVHDGPVLASAIKLLADARGTPASTRVWLESSSDCSSDRERRVPGLGAVQVLVGQVAQTVAGAQPEHERRRAQAQVAVDQHGTAADGERAGQAHRHGGPAARLVGAGDGGDPAPAPACAGVCPGRRLLANGADGVSTIGRRAVLDGLSVAPARHRRPVAGQRQGEELSTRLRPDDQAAREVVPPLVRGVGRADHHAHRSVGQGDEVGEGDGAQLAGHHHRVDGAAGDHLLEVADRGAQPGHLARPAVHCERGVVHHAQQAGLAVGVVDGQRQEQGHIERVHRAVVPASAAPRSGGKRLTCSSPVARAVAMSRAWSAVASTDSQLTGRLAAAARSAGPNVLG